MSNPLLRLFGSGRDARFQSATDNALPTPSPQDSAQTLTVNLTTSFQDFPHRLGRKYTGYAVEQNPSSLGVLVETSTDPKLFIRLRCSAGSGTVTLRVY